jgi:hypothetical protein
MLYGKGYRFTNELKRDLNGLVSNVYLEPQRLVRVVREDRGKRARRIAKGCIELELAPLAHRGEMQDLDIRTNRDLSHGT